MDNHFELWMTLHGGDSTSVGISVSANRNDEWVDDSNVLMALMDVGMPRLTGCEVEWPWRFVAMVCIAEYPYLTAMAQMSHSPDDPMDRNFREILHEHLLEAAKDGSADTGTFGFRIYESGRVEEVK